MKMKFKTPITLAGTVILGILLAGCGNGEQDIEPKATPATSGAAEASVAPVAETASETSDAAEAAKVMEDLINSSLAADKDEIMSNRILVTPNTTSTEYGDINARLITLIPELESVVVNFEVGADPDKKNEGTYFEYVTFLGLSQLANGTDVSVAIPETAVTIDGISANVRTADFVFSGSDPKLVNGVKEVIQTVTEFPLTSYYDDKWTLLVAAETTTE